MHLRDRRRYNNTPIMGLSSTSRVRADRIGGTTRELLHDAGGSSLGLSMTQALNYDKSTHSIHFWSSRIDIMTSWLATASTTGSSWRRIATLSRYPESVRGLPNGRSSTVLVGQTSIQVLWTSSREKHGYEKHFHNVAFTLHGLANNSPDWSL